MVGNFREGFPFQGGAMPARSRSLRAPVTNPPPPPGCTLPPASREGWRPEGPPRARLSGRSRIPPPTSRSVTPEGPSPPPKREVGQKVGEMVEMGDGGEAGDIPQEAPHTSDGVYRAALTCIPNLLHVSHVHLQVLPRDYQHLTCYMCALHVFTLHVCVHACIQA